MRALLLLVALTLVACGGDSEDSDHASGHPGSSGDETAHGHDHDFSDVERFAALFDDPARDEWQRPSDVVAMLELEAGMTVADVGAGTGYFGSYLSEAVGVDGHVLALDSEEAMVAHMRQRFEEAGLENIEARAVEPNDPGLGAGSVDRILIVDTWHHIEDRGSYARRLTTALRPGGFVLVVDFTEDSPHGPPAGMRLNVHHVRTELMHGGLEASEVQSSLPYQYVVRGSVPGA